MSLKPSSMLKACEEILSKNGSKEIPTFSMEEIKAAFKQADLDDDGQVDYDEFLYMMGSSKVSTFHTVYQPLTALAAVVPGLAMILTSHIITHASYAPSLCTCVR
jgi:hypothetical protein